MRRTPSDLRSDVKRHTVPSGCSCAFEERCCHGAALVEFVVTFPLFLLMFMGVAQIGQLYLGKIFIRTAAYRAARAALVTPELNGGGSSVAWQSAQQAATETMAWLQPANALARTTVSQPDVGASQVAVEVSFDYHLIFPFAGQALARLLGGQLPGNGWPFVTMREYVVLEKPWPN